MARKFEIPVTDHAVLRWIERFCFVDVEAIRAQIHTETREALNAGAKRLRINGIEYRMQGGKVITLISHRQPCRPLKWGNRL